MSEIFNTCRTCMKQNNLLTNVFNNLERNVDTKIVEALSECTTIKIEDGDGLPQSICCDCISSLKVSYSFRCQVLQVDQQLKTACLHIKNEKYMKIENDLSSDCLSNPGEYDDEGEEIGDILKQEHTDFECKKLSTENKHKSHTTQNDDNSEEIVEFHSEVPVEEYMQQGVCGNNTFDQVKDGMLLDAEYLLQNCNKEAKAHSITKYKCSECNLEFSKRKLLVNHIKKHQNSSYTCEVCGVLFSTKNLLYRHKKMHLGDKPYKCSECQKSYFRSDQYQSHMKRHAGIKPNICPFCNKGFAQSCNLKDHIRTHTGETPYLCSLCGKGFNNSSNLRQHALRHTGVKPYSCTLCPKTFCTKGQMIGHMDTHTGAQPYKCEQCGSSFTKPQSLKKHSRLHLGLKPFECDVCPMRFADKNHLKRHQRSHTGEKPYQCKYCDRAFAQTNDLIKHLRIHVGKNIYKCSVCGLGFRLQSELRRHYPTHYMSESAGASVTSVDASLAPPPPQPCSDALAPATNPAHQDAKITITFTGDYIDKTSYHQNFTIDVIPEKN